MREGTELPVVKDTPSARLIGTLAIAGALAGLLIVVVYVWAQPRIEEYQAQVLRAAVQEVLGAPARTVTLYVVDGELTDVLPAGADSLSLERLFQGFDEADRPVGVAIIGAQPGFQDIIRLIFGYDPVEGRLLGMLVLESKETPGLGDKIIKDTAFVAEFQGVGTPLRGVKPGSGAEGESDVDMITGATISSRAVIAIINDQIEALGPLLDAYRERLAATPPAVPEALPERTGSSRDMRVEPRVKGGGR